MHRSAETSDPWSWDLDATPVVATGSRRWLALALGASIAVLFVAAGGRVAFTGQSAPPPAPRLAAAATVITVIRPQGAADTRGEAVPVAGAQQRAVARIGALSLPADASLVRLSSAKAVGRLTPVGSNTAAQVSVGKVSLLGGRIEARGIDMRSNAELDGSAASGRIGHGTPVGELTVDGTPVPTRANTQVVVDGVGTLTVNEQAIVAPSGGDAVSGPRWRATGAALHLRTTRPVAGLPAGSEILIGQVDASVRAPGRDARRDQQPAGGDDAPTSSGPRTASPGAAYGGLIPGAAKPGSAGMPRRSADVRAVAPRPTGSLQGYTFPILGEASYSNDFHGARATGTHHATDIFARTGTPVVAVADGVLDRVGWNSLGGHRLWLHDAWGNSFYYAHLSAFSPVAVDGAFVRAGDVLGFVGDTGNAKGTPPHLHFEIHDSSGRVRNPFPFLNRWHRGSVGVAVGTLGSLGPAAATLLGANDVSAVNDAVTNNPAESVPAPGDAGSAADAQLDGNVLHR